jgi:hypothetical protein
LSVYNSAGHPPPHFKRGPQHSPAASRR